MIAQLLESVKLEGAPQARAALVAIRDALVGHVLALNQTIDLVDLVIGTSAPTDAASVDESEAPRRGRKKRGGRRPSMLRTERPARAKANGHAGKAFVTRGGKPSIAARVHQVLADAPAEGMTSEDCAKRVKGIDARRASITLAALTKSGRAKKVSYGHYVAA